jgi:hypothetical protein
MIIPPESQFPITKNLQNSKLSYDYKNLFDCKFTHQVCDCPGNLELQIHLNLNLNTTSSKYTKVTNSIEHQTTTRFAN